MTTYDVVVKLIGPIQPVGDSSKDLGRLKNLVATIELVNKLLYDIYLASKESERPEHSMRVIGQRAKDFLKVVKDVDFNQ